LRHSPKKARGNNVHRADVRSGVSSISLCNDYKAAGGPTFSNGNDYLPRPNPLLAHSTYISAWIPRLERRIEPYIIREDWPELDFAFENEEVVHFMATIMKESCISEIGETAGKVWQLLNDKGSLSVAKLVKDIDIPRDVVMQALGWLAREDKIEIEEDGRSRTVSLR
jgi:hypothetical protein